MNLIGMKVDHRKFGQGKILNILDNKVEIGFTQATKFFLYPEAFELHITILDKNGQNFVVNKLNELNDLKSLEQEQQIKKLQASRYSAKQKTLNAQAIFAMNLNNVNEVLENWTVSTGRFLSGKSKGKPKIPLNMGMSSCCILTEKAKTADESKRTIVGLFMTEDYFIGKECVDGLITAHENYRLIWNEDYAKLLLWEYFPESLRPAKWGSAEIKYTSKNVVKKILEDMVEFSEGDDKNKILDFYRYFCQKNGS